ncbi:MAG TPA: DUF4382 domain-containing protein [Terriglobia bacterium]|nr:DUF4382 domain-containing protein [Terriglobia bacterium]
MKRTTFLGLTLVFAIALPMFVSCGGSNSSTASPSNLNQSPSTPSTTGAVTISLSDPATCAAPNGSFTHVWVTITKVTANISSDAGPSDSGWQTVLDLTSGPKQIDLLSLVSTTCVLTQLGSTTGLPPGDYQQIRVYLLANDASGAVPAPNNCGPMGFNCVALADGAMVELQLSSEAQTGIKIPAGQMMGGGLNLMAGQSADLNIDFSTCESIVQEGNGKFRLKPVLHAGEVSLNTNSISGTVINASTKAPVANAMVMVEQPDLNGIDRVVESELTAADGTFIFCPLSPGNYDVVVAASTPTPVRLPPIGSAATYNATVTFKTPTGASLTIPLVAETQSGMSSSPAELAGTITSGGAQAAGVDVSVSTLQQAAPVGGALVEFTVPAFSGSVSSIETASGPPCASGTDCANYTLYVPASNPSVGTYSSSGTTYSAPQAGNVPYTVDAQAFLADGSNTADCSPSDLDTSFDSGGGALLAIGGATLTVKTLAFSGCH